MPLYDLRCENGHVEQNVYARPKEYDPCPECGADREPTWGGAFAKRVAFVPIYDEIVGWIRTREDWEAHRAAVAERQGVPLSDIVYHRETRTEMVTKGEEAKHRAWEARRRRGIDDKQLAEIRQDTRRFNVNPLTGERGRGYTGRPRE